MGAAPSTKTDALRRIRGFRHLRTRVEGALQADHSSLPGSAELGPATTLRFSAEAALGIPDRALLLVLLESAPEALVRSRDAARLNEAP